MVKKRTKILFDILVDNFYNSVRLRITNYRKFLFDIYKFIEFVYEIYDKLEAFIGNQGLLNDIDSPNIFVI